MYALSDLLLKIGNTELNSSLSTIFQGNFLLNLFENINIVLAFCIAMFSKLVMGYVLSKNPLNISEGLFLALSVLITFLLGVIFFKENCNIKNIFGLIFIIIGFFFIYYGKNDKRRNSEIISDKKDRDE